MVACRGPVADEMSPKPGIIASALVGILLLAFAVSVDFPKANGDRFKGDESTYYMLGPQPGARLRLSVRAQGSHSRLGGIFRTGGRVPEDRQGRRDPRLQLVSRSFRWLKREDPERETRLYFSKSYIYPLIAAPFIVFFGTNGFLVLHAMLIAFDLLVIYLFVLGRDEVELGRIADGDRVSGRVGRPGVFRLAHAGAVQFLARAVCRVFLGLQGSAPARRKRRPLRADRILIGPASDYIAALLVGLATFSKPPHLLVLLPMVLLAASRRQWRRAAGMLVICGAVTAGLFALNAAITGEFNYQGGDRKTFYSSIGFPFANTWETFDNISAVRGREDLMVGDVLVNTHSGTVLRHNLWYFLVGRNAGLLPYFFPGHARDRAVPVLEAEASLAMAVAGDDRRCRRDARLRVAVHLERRRRPRRQPVLFAVLRVVPGAHSGDGRPRRRDRRVRCVGRSSRRSS